MIHFLYKIYKTLTRYGFRIWACLEYLLLRTICLGTEIIYFFHSLIFLILAIFGAKKGIASVLQAIKDNEDAAKSKALTEIIKKLTEEEKRRFKEFDKNEQKSN